MSLEQMYGELYALQLFAQVELDKNYNPLLFASLFNEEQKLKHKIAQFEAMQAYSMFDNHIIEKIITLSSSDCDSPPEYCP